MAPKGKKKDGGGAKSGAQAPAAKNSEDFLLTLLTKIQQVSRNKSRCTDILQALTDGKCSVLEQGKQGEESGDCYWILLSSHVLEKLTRYLERNQGDETVAVVVSALCHALATTLFVDRTKLERCAQKTGAVRSALGRAIMSVTMASTCALQSLGQGPGDVEASLIRRAVWAATTALDMTVNHATVKATAAASDGWNHAQHWCLEDAAQIDVDHEDGLASLCQDATRLLKFSKEEHACLAALVDTDVMPSPSASAKRRRAARTSAEETPPSGIAAHFQTLKDTQLSTHIDGRVSVRRWSSMTFVWFCQGQQRILEFVDALLSDCKFWNSVLECPAVVGPKDPPQKAASKSKRGAPKRSVEPSPKTIPPVHIPGNVAAVALASRLLSILSEAGTSCGARAPSGGMDTYAANVLGLTGSGKGRGRAPADSIPSWTRPDVRNLASVVIYKLVQSHTDCLRKNCTSPEAFGCVLVNDDTEGFGASVPSGTVRPLRARFYPAVNKSLNSFCFAAASSASDPTRVGDSNKRLMAITSAFILASGEQVRSIVDAKLYGFAVGELTECLRTITSDDDRASTPRAMDVDSDEGQEARYDRLNKQYGLDSPLPVPTLEPASTAKSSRKKKKKSDSSNEQAICTFGGMFPHKSTQPSQGHQNITDEELLSLLICAVQSTSDESPPSAAMFTELIEIVHCCYDLKEPAFEATASEDSSSKRKGKKRAAPAKTSQGKKKRKKVSAEASEEISHDEDGRRTPKSMKSARAGLAADALNALRMFLVRIPASSSASHSRRELRNYLRETLTTEHICNVVDLNGMINEALMESRLASEAQKKASADGASAAFFSVAHSNDFRPYERLLWTAHIKMCQTIGRGHPSNGTSQVSNRPVLGDAKQRLNVFHSVASSGAAARKSSAAKDASTPPTKWPLSLPATQHALISSNLINEPIPNEAGATPERFIAHAFMSSITAALEDPSILTNVEWYKPNFEFKDSQGLVSDDDVPLSLRDARLFVLAVCRLPTKEQTEFLNTFVSAVSSALDDWMSSAANSALIEEDADVSGFVARVVTVCATLVNVVTVGPQLRDALAAQVVPVTYSMPNFVTSQELSPKRRLEGGDWYRSETSFVGLFSDWESPLVPGVTGAVPPGRLVSGDTISNLRSLHASAIKLGFRSAKHNRCHLLFSAWNASGRNASWESSPEFVSRTETSAVDEDNATQRLVDLRDDVCVMHREIHGNDSLFQDSILTKFLTERGDGRRPGQLKRKLEAMMSKAEAIIDSILATKSPPSGKSLDLPLVSFALLESLSVYVAFIVAAHTRSIDNFLSPSRAGRGALELSDDDSASSGGDYHEGADDERIDVLMKLNEACEKFGASPAHPDWLDAGCYLRDGIAAEDATKIAHRAVICLERLCSVARAAHVKFMSESMACFFEDDHNRERRAELALNLCLSRLDTTGVSDDDDKSEKADQWADAIAAVCGLETWQVKMFSGLSCCKNSNHVAETFCQNAVQRIVGSLQIRNGSFEDWTSSLAEYRACGDWELLLSDALIGSCDDLELPEETSKLEQILAFRRNYALAGRWARVQQACVSHLMPAAALLRFGLSEGLGRSRHPLLIQITGGADGGECSTASSTPLRFSDPLPSSSSRSISSQANDDVARTLATLVRIPASNEQTDLVKPQCSAVAANLMIDSKAFSHLQSMEDLRLTFENMRGLRELATEIGDPTAKQASSVSYLLERLVTSIDGHGSLRLSDDGKPPRLGGLSSFLGGQRLSFDIITKNDTDHTAVLSDFSWQQVQDEALTEIAELLSSPQWGLTTETWSRLSDMLSCLTRSDRALSSGQEKEPVPLTRRLVKALNTKDDSYLRTLVQWIICDPTVKPRPDMNVLEKISADMCTFLCFAVGAAGHADRKSSDDFKGGKIILDALMETMDSWLRHESQFSNDVMSLLCVLGARHNSLHTIGSRLLTIVTAGNESPDMNCIGPVERFFRFLRDLEAALLSSSQANMNASAVTSLRTDDGTVTPGGADTHNDKHTADTSPNACSFVLQPGFHQQHWYNCYTCNLVWDKGCCTLCALRCHKDHDVTYSRHSSFFCDCGGEAPTEEENRSPCQCLSSIDSQEARMLFDGQRWPVIDPPAEVCQADGHAPSHYNEDGDLYLFAVSVASSCVRQTAMSSLNTLKAEAESQSWTKLLFAALRSSHEHRQVNRQEEPCTDVPADTSAPTEGTDVDGETVPSLAGRSGNVLNLQTLEQKALLPIRSARSSTFQLSLSNDGTTDRVKRAALARNGVRRRAVVADFRGRMIIAEPSSLLFCAALPSVNARYEEKSPELPYGRGQMSILGSHSTNFNIVGMELCRDNERHLVAWGTGEASVMVLNNSFDKVERTIRLNFNLESDEVDYLIKCVWLPGSQTMVAVVCGLFVKVFDLQNAEDDKADSLVSYGLAIEALIRDAALVPSSRAATDDRENSSSFSNKVAEDVKLFLLLDIGQLLELHLCFDESGQLQEQGDLYIESGEGISLPVGGVRVNHSGQPASEGARMRSMGEASGVTFLPRAGVLLYACLSSPVLVLLLDDAGGVSGSFELLPYIVKGTALGTGPAGYSIHGPFTHFTELGCVEYDDVKYFRVVCVGKSSRTGQPKLLCVDFNRDAVRVKEVPWSTGVGMSSTSQVPTSFPGLATFSAPVLTSAADTNDSLKRSDFAERSYLCVVASNGGMTMYGEEMIEDDTAIVQRNRPDKKEPTFPLTLFEKLVNVSDADELTFAGDRIGSADDSDSVKSKLSPNNSTYYMCPSRDGCTITISLQKGNDGAMQPPSQDKEHAPLSHDVMQRELVVVAVRLLVGSTTTEFIPKYISIEGRRVWLRPDLKKHYDLPLTAEEIASSLRNGFVSLGIGPSFDSGNNPLIDAIEVYAARREQISHWLPLTCSEMHSDQPDEAVTSQVVTRLECSAGEDKLALSVASLTHLLQVLGATSEVSPEAHETIRQLVQGTALEDGGQTRQSLVMLLNYIEPDSCKRKKILDEGTLTGVLSALQSTNENLVSGREEGSSSQSEGDAMDVDVDDERAHDWATARQTVKDCLHVAAAVAGERPRNYKEVLEKKLSEESTEYSVATVADSIVTRGLKKELDCKDLIPDLVELCLTESLLFNGRNETPTGSFATFHVLARILGAADEDIVKVCCDSVLAYWKQHLSKSDPVISYQCDGCSLFPITGTRYTFPEGGSSQGQDNDIDLCSDCYSMGRLFAARNHYDTRVHVKIGDKTVGKKAKLSCARLGQMKRLAIPMTWLSTADASEAASQNQKGIDKLPPADIDLENFPSILFNDLLRLLTDRLKQGDLDFPLTSFRSLMDLVLGVVRSSDDDALLSRVKMFAETVLEFVPSFIDIITRNGELEQTARSVLVICMQSLARLATAKNDLSGGDSMLDLDECSVEDTSPRKLKEKTDPRFVCEVHGVPAVRRRCSHGPQKNRRFYVCGMDRSSRCSYFKWADSEDGQVASIQDLKCKFTDEIGRLMWGLLNKSGGPDPRPICRQLCELLEHDLHDKESGALVLPADVMGANVDITDGGDAGNVAPSLPSRYDQLAAASDYVDGVFCAQEKLRGVTSKELVDNCHRERCNSSNHREATLFTAALDLLAYFGDTASEGNEELGELEPPGWFPLLCEVLSSSKSPRYRALAKRALKRLCGGNKVVYQSVRDHYVFSFHFRELLRHTRPALLAALNVKEQARQCGTEWRAGANKTTFRQLPAGGLIGTNDLVSEDCVAVALSARIGSSLDELIISAGTARGENWRNFCSLTTLPGKAAERSDASANRALSNAEADVDLLTVPPIVSLVWIASVLSGENQIKVLRLLAVALNNPNGAHPARRLLAASSFEGKAKADTDTAKDCEALLRYCTPSSLPETILLQGDKALLADEVHAFTVQFVLAGNSLALRRAGSQVAARLCAMFQGEDLEWLLSQLTDRALSDLPDLGSTCNELLGLLKSLASRGHTLSSSAFLSIGRKVVEVFTSQLRLMGHEKSFDFFASPGDKDSKVPSEKSYDLTSCVYCQRARDPSHPPSGTASSSQTSGVSRSTTAQVGGPDVAMLPEQVRPFARESLEASTDASLSTEFSLYVQLKCRLAISNIHVSIGDPRGRYVKTIAVYFSPRQVSDANELKSEGYADSWQQCATIPLQRGATRASVAISPPIIAANLRIEYLDFYERPGGSRAEDGSLLLHCPRCTRVVSNAHGVCGHCGEVAFQCRKCRHINYLRLDAFLCVECGYCSAASFSYDLTCGAASNAVAVVDDDSYERSIKTLRVATKLHEELRSTLNERMRTSNAKRSLSAQKYGPTLKRTFLGELPRISKEKTDPIVSSSGRRLGSLAASSSSGGDYGNPSAAGNRARSLLRLARQLRNESSSSDRSRVSDLLVRQSLLGHSGSTGISIDDIDELGSDLVGFASSDVDSSDPLSRLVASIQGRSSRSSAARGASSGGGGGGPSRSSAGANDSGQTGNEESAEALAKAAAEESDRLYHLMRESERECYELRRRINAWRRLENDALADLGATEASPSKAFSPTQCSTCCGPVALQLLDLFMALFESKPEVVESAITENFIRALFDESAELDKDLFDSKRTAIANLATKSDRASKIILDQLRLRMNGSRDAASAQIMGMIMAIDSPRGEKFVNLAAEILECGY